MRKFFESFISLFIILVVISTILEDIFTLAWPFYKDIFIVINFIFDSVFTIEFIVRSIYSRKESDFYNYFTTGLGWIDFITSIPLLVLNSAPTLFYYLNSDVGVYGFSLINFISVMKIAKIIRITRIFRLLRFLKVLKNINFLDSKIAQRHINYLVSLVITLVVLCVIIFNILGFNINNFTKDDSQKRYNFVLSSALDISIKTGTDFSYVLKDILNKDQNVIECIYRGNKILTKNFDIIFSYISYIEKIDFNNVSIYYIDYSLLKNESIFNLIIIAIILILSFGMTFIYSKKFAIEVSDPIILVSKGFNEPDFFLRLREDYKHKDELRELITGYNNIWLNTKVKYSYEIYQDKIKLDVDNIDIDDLIKGV